MEAKQRFSDPGSGWRSLSSRGASFESASGKRKGKKNSYLIPHGKRAQGRTSAPKRRRRRFHWRRNVSFRRPPYPTTGHPLRTTSPSWRGASPWRWVSFWIRERQHSFFYRREKKPSAEVLSNVISLFARKETFFCELWHLFRTPLSFGMSYKGGSFHRSVL